MSEGNYGNPENEGPARTARQELASGQGPATARTGGLHPTRAPAWAQPGGLRFHLVQDVIDRLPHLGSKGACLKRTMQDEPIEHQHYIGKARERLAEIRKWKGRRRDGAGRD